ncbi:M23 family metallopeptidase [Haloferacaceae archaeon DSL9]
MVSLRTLEPSSLALLGVLSLPGYVFESLAPLRLFAICFLFFLVPSRATLRRWIGRVDGRTEDPLSWLEYAEPRKYYLRYYASLPLTTLNPFVFVTGIAQVLGHVWIRRRWGGALPTPERYETDIRYRLPFDGTWTVLGGGLGEEHSHSWGLLTQRYAYDFVITDDRGRTHRGDGTALEDYHCYGEPVLAPADGTVVDVRNAHRDCPHPGGWLDWRTTDIRGNYVTIEHAPDEYSVLAHLVPGSIPVAVGDEVTRGQRVGRCGNSGNSTEPHLHFHLQDTPDFIRSMGLPVRFDGVAAATGTGAFDAPNDGRAIAAGQRVRPAPAGSKIESETPGPTNSAVRQ